MPVRRFAILSLVLVSGAGCSSPPAVDYTPLTVEVRRLQSEAEVLAVGEDSQSHLQASRRLLARGEEMLRGPKPPATVAPLREAEAAARTSLAASVWERRRIEAAEARTGAAEVHRQWQDAVRLLEQSEKVAGRTVSGVVREMSPEPVITPLPDLPPSPGDTTITAVRLRQAAEAWTRAGRDLGVPVSDARAEVERTLTRLGDPELTPDRQQEILAQAVWPLLEMAYRVRAEAVQRQGRRTLQQAVQYGEYRDHALWSMVELERGMKESVRKELEEERERMANREQALYESLQQFEGQFATIRREARGTILSLSDILFDFDKATLRREAEFNLVKVATILQQFPEMGIMIEGHTDNIGSEEYNLKLSQRRAQTVYDFVVEQGIPEDHLEIKAFGMSQPVASNETPEGRQANRRVDLVIAEK